MNPMRHTVGVLGTIVLVIGLLALVGHIVNMSQLYRWTNDVGMAFNTSIAFILVGVAIILIAISDRLWTQQ